MTGKDAVDEKCEVAALQRAARAALDKRDFEELLRLVLAPPSRLELECNLAVERSPVMKWIRSLLNRAGLRGVQQQVEADQVLESFLCKKLTNPAFLKALATAEKPFALLKVAVCNFTRDHIRTRIRLVAAEEDEGQILDEGPSPDVALEAQQSRAGVTQGLADILAGMLAEDALLLSVMRPDIIFPSEDMVNGIAQLRHVHPERVRQELLERSETQEAQMKAEQAVRRRAADIERLQDKVRRLHRMALELDGCLATPDNSMDVERKRRVSGVVKEFRHATAEERAAVVHHHQERLETMFRKQAEDQQRVERGCLPAWRELAVLLGHVPPDASGTKLDKASAAIRQRWSRLQRKLRRQYSRGEE